MSREVWRDFICSPDRATRHLSFIGQGVGGTMADAVDLAALEDFLRRLSGADGDIALLSDAVDLLTGGYAPFMRRTLPDLIDVMASEAVSKQSVVGPGLRGNPVWGRTVLGRLTGTLSPAHFISRTSHRSFELPENRLVRWLVADVGTAINRIMDRVGSKALHPDLVAMLSAGNMAARHHAFGEIGVPDRLSPDLEAAGGRHRRAPYRNAARLARRRADVRRDDEETWWNNILSLLSVGWLEPIEDDRLFELYVLVLVMTVLAEECGLGEPVEIGLVTTRRRHVALFDRGDVRVRLYFNQTPSSVLNVETSYQRVVDSYAGITGAPRRPDVVLVVERDGVRRLVIIEAKETGDRAYISESIYKVFGYLHDFADVLGAEPGVKAILLVPEGITRSPSAHPGPMRIASAHRREDVAAALADAVTP